MEMIDESIQKGKDHSFQLHIFAAMGQVENCREYIDRYKYVNHQDDLGWTPLMYAARFGHLDTLKFLHSIGGSLTSKNNFDYTPLCMAVANNCKEVFEYILQELRRCKDHYLKNETIAFELACVLGRTEFLKSFLLAEEFDVNNVHCSLPGLSPLLLAVYSGNVETVEFLLASGAKPSSAITSCPSAIDIAIYNRDDRMKELFSMEKLTPSLTPTLLSPSIDLENSVFNFSPTPYNLAGSGYRLNQPPQRDTMDCDFYNLDGLLSPRFLKPDENRKWLGSIENNSDKNLNDVKSFSRRKYIMWMSQKFNKRRTKSANDVSEEDKSKKNRGGTKIEDGCIFTHLLTELKLEKYITKFRKNEIDQFTIFTLTDDDLIAMGISKKRERLNILETLKNYCLENLT